MSCSVRWASSTNEPAAPTSPGIALAFVGPVHPTVPQRRTHSDRWFARHRRHSDSFPDLVTPSSASSTRAPVLFRAVIIMAVLAALFAGGRGLVARLPGFAAYVEGLGAVGPVIFILGYALAAVAFIPGSLLTLAAGAVFGITRGVVIVFLGASLGSILSFLLARYVARSTIERRLAGNARFAAIDEAIAAQGRRIVLLLRLSPVFPFSILNYALGLTRISLTDYAIAGIGMLPGTFLYVYYGKLAGDVASIAGGTSAPKDSAYYLLLALGLVATVVVTTVVARIARAALRTATSGAAA